LEHTDFAAFAQSRAVWELICSVICSALCSDFPASHKGNYFIRRLGISAADRTPNREIALCVWRYSLSCGRRRKSVFFLQPLQLRYFTFRLPRSKSSQIEICRRRASRIKMRRKAVAWRCRSAGPGRTPGKVKCQHPAAYQSRPFAPGPHSSCGCSVPGSRALQSPPTPPAAALASRLVLKRKGFCFCVPVPRLPDQLAGRRIREYIHALAKSERHLTFQVIENKRRLQRLKSSTYTLEKRVSDVYLLRLRRWKKRRSSTYKRFVNSLSFLFSVEVSTYASSVYGQRAVCSRPETGRSKEKPPKSS
jgi:hypothetical protein